MDCNDDFLPLTRNYKNLTVYQIAECIDVVTYYFATTHIGPGDRTRDQMVQGVRSGKQNIAEGSVDGATSTEMEIRLMNCARGSMQELRTDYEDYLRRRGLPLWSKDDPRVQQVRQFVRRCKDPEVYLAKVKERSPETIANIALTMIHAYDYLMERLIESIKRRFLQQGGIKEAMYRARKRALDPTGNPGRTERTERTERNERTGNPENPGNPGSETPPPTPSPLGKGRGAGPQSSQSSQSSQKSQSSQSSQSSQKSQNSQESQNSQKSQNNPS